MHVAIELLANTFSQRKDFSSTLKVGGVILHLDRELIPRQGGLIAWPAIMLLKMLNARNPNQTSTLRARHSAGMIWCSQLHQM